MQAKGHFDYLNGGYPLINENEIVCFQRPKQSYRVFNTWMGDPSKLVLLEAIVDVILKENLLDRVTRVGNYTLQQLIKMENEFSNCIDSSRGRGTFIAFNCASSQLRDSVIKKLLKKGQTFV